MLKHTQMYRFDALYWLSYYNNMFIELTSTFDCPTPDTFVFSQSVSDNAVHWLHVCLRTFSYSFARGGWHLDAMQEKYGLSECRINIKQVASTLDYSGYI